MQIGLYSCLFALLKAYSCARLACFRFSTLWTRQNAPPSRPAQTTHVGLTWVAPLVVYTRWFEPLMGRTQRHESIKANSLTARPPRLCLYVYLLMCCVVPLVWHCHLTRQVQALLAVVPLVSCHAVAPSLISQPVQDPSPCISLYNPRCL